jgi:hypothetical protein
MMSVHFNPPPGWPPVPQGWVPPAGWQPDPSWPAPPPGWSLWTEDADSKELQVRAARWVIAGGAAAFLGSLLPFLSSSQPDLYQVNSAPAETAEFFGIVLAVLGLFMLARSRHTRLIAGILTLIAAGLTASELVLLTAVGVAGFEQTDPFGDTVRVNFSPHAGIFISILGCAVAGIGAIMSFSARRRAGFRSPQTGASRVGE